MMSLTKSQLVSLLGDEVIPSSCAPSLASSEASSSGAAGGSSPSGKEETLPMARNLMSYEARQRFLKARR